MALYNLELYNEALADFERILAQHPDNIEALYQQGLTLYRLENFQSAREVLQRVRSLDPNHAEARRALGDVNSAMDNQRIRLNIEQRAARQSDNSCNCSAAGANRSIFPTFIRNLIRILSL
jgi:tetratricopeptide (TPR) repeat protein